MELDGSGLSLVLRRAAVGLALVVLASCAPLPPADLLDPWLLTDLRLLDADDGGGQEVHPAQDLIAVYLRQSGDDLQIRLDFLEPGDFDQFDLYLAFDNLPGDGTAVPIELAANHIHTDLAWESLLSIPAHGPLTLKNPAGEAIPSAAVLVWRDPLQQSLLIRLDRRALSARIARRDLVTPLKIQVFVTPAGGKTIMDQSGTVRLQAHHPRPAQALLAFWNAYPAYTPASTLRRWDGAHTGPFGGRHGLYNLLRAARSAQTPLVLLDLNQPAALSALDYAGGLESIQSMQDEGLLALPRPLLDPDYGPFKPGADFRPEMNQISDRLGLNSGGMIYLPPQGEPPASGDEVVFWRTTTAEFQYAKDESDLRPSQAGSSPFRWRNHLVIPVPTELSTDPEQASREGLTTEWKRRLLQSALHAGTSANTASIVVLGGDLPASAWGDPQSARATLRWLRQHPWAQVLNPAHLTSLRAAAAPAPQTALESWRVSSSRAKTDELAQAIQAAPDNAITQAAWQAYSSLFAPVSPTSLKLPALRANYVGQVWSLLAAAQWAAWPSSVSSCDLDPDRDGEEECVLASEKVYAQFEVADGSVSYLFIHLGNVPTGGQTGVHQLIGPSSQFITGLSEASRWNDQAGLKSDPEVISGAFSGPGIGYLPKPGARTISFHLPDGHAEKIYRLTETGLEAEFRCDTEFQGQAFSIPLALDPWRRFAPGWTGGYRSIPGSHTWGWGIEGGPLLQIRASAPLQGTDFTLSQALLSRPEDPNQDFPSGHYLPFPLALVTLPVPTQLQVAIEAISNP